MSLKHVKRGDSVTSLLSFIDVLAVSLQLLSKKLNFSECVMIIFGIISSQGNESVYKSVTAKAVEPSQVIRLPMKALKEVFDENPGMQYKNIHIHLMNYFDAYFFLLQICWYE